MSWDVTLMPEPGSSVPYSIFAWMSWNYTHNVNGMIHKAMTRAGIPFVLYPGSNSERYRMDRVAAGSKCGFRPEGFTASMGSEGLDWRSCSMTCCEPSWWRVLDGRPGPDGLRILYAIMEQWSLAPGDYQAMNPENGWGNFDGVRRVFEEMMAAATTEQPLRWECSG